MNGLNVNGTLISFQKKRFLTKRNTENQVSKVITKLKPVVFTNENNPFIKEKNIKVNKNICFADKVIDVFLKEDIVLISKDEYVKILELITIKVN